MNRADVKRAIAQAIKDADRSWFNEDYDRQAAAVVKALNAKGLAIVPLSPEDGAIEAGKDAMSAGRYKQEEILAHLYAAMVKAGKL